MSWIVLIHVTALVGLILFPLPGWPLLATAWTLMFLGGFGTTVAYHRGLAHRAVRLHPGVEAVLIALAIFNGSGTPASWTANHRRHHAHSDTERDVSSPQVGGFWWSHLRWLWQSSQSSIARWAPDLDTRYGRFWSHAQVPILALSFFGGLPFGPAAFFWMGSIRLVVALHGQCFVNSVAHMRRGAPPGEDASQNQAWLGFVQAFQGENWHRNHHLEPNSARLGRRWWQIDLGWWLILLFEKAGLADRVRRPKGVK